MTQLFHEAIGFPQAVEAQGLPCRLRYGAHAQQEALKDGVEDLPYELPSWYRVVEVEVVDGKVSKWVVRTALDQDRDLVLVVVADGFVKTVWTNRADDNHTTLRRSRYTKPQAFRA